MFGIHIPFRLHECSEDPAKWCFCTKYTCFQIKIFICTSPLKKNSWYSTAGTQVKTAVWKEVHRHGDPITNLLHVVSFMKMMSWCKSQMFGKEPEAVHILGQLASNKEIKGKVTLKLSNPVPSSCRTPCKLLWLNLLQLWFSLKIPKLQYIVYFSWPIGTCK